MEGSLDHKLAIQLFESFPKDELFATPTDEIRASIVEDCGQNPESGILCTFKKTSTSPLGFGGGGR